MIGRRSGGRRVVCDGRRRPRRAKPAVEARRGRRPARMAAAIPAPPRRPGTRKLGEEVDGAAAYVLAWFDLNYGGRSGGSERGGRRRPPRRGREEGEGGDYAGDFSEKPVCFSVIAERSIAALNCGLRVRFVFFRNCKKVTRRVVIWTAGSIFRFWEGFFASRSRPSVPQIGRPKQFG